ncbi:MAG: flagellar hook-associated protein FlgK [Alphaproteobacteria bacterium]
MSLTVTLGTALTGLRVNQKAIEIASQNVANASTPGYSRQIVHREALTAGGLGAGVGMATISRTVDDFLIREIRTQSAALGADTARSAYLSRTQDLFGSLANNTSFTVRVTDLATRIGALVNEPESAARRLDLVQAAQSFALAMTDATGSIQAMRRDADREIDQSVRTLNEQLAQIDELNRQIVQHKALGREPNELLDARDAAVAKVAELVDIQSFTRESGETVLYTRSGKPLVDGRAHQFAYTPAPAVTVDTSFGEVLLDGAPLGGALQSGKLKALIELRDQTLPGLQAQLDVLSEKVRDQVNLAHNRGTAVPAPDSLAGSRVFADVNAERITISAPVRIAAVDAGGVIQAHHDVPAGSYSIAELRDLVNARMGGAITATAGDGLGFGLTAAGGLGVAMVDLAPNGGDATVTHTVDGATREYRGLSNFLGLNDLFVTPGRSPGDERAGIAGSIGVHPAIMGDPARIAHGRLNDTPAPQAGTTLGVATGDARALAGMASALDARVAFGAVGGLPAFSGTVAEYATQILSANAQQAAGASNRMDYQSAMLTDLSNRAANVSGVSIDEEMANLVAWQSAYAASARVVSVASEMLDILINLR